MSKHKVGDRVVVAPFGAMEIVDVHPNGNVYFVRLDAPHAGAMDYRPAFDDLKIKPYCGFIVDDDEIASGTVDAPTMVAVRSNEDQCKLLERDIHTWKPEDGGMPSFLQFLQSLGMDESDEDEDQ